MIPTLLEVQAVGAAGRMGQQDVNPPGVPVILILRCLKLPHPQASNKRLHRQGQQEKVIIHHLVCSGTRDEDVMQALQRKDDAQNWVMESLKARIRRIKDGN